MTDHSPVWGLHCKENIDLVGGGVAAMGPDELEDLSALDATKDAFKQALAAARPDAKAGAISQWASQVYRFVHEAREGDAVVYRERHGGAIYVGRITGPYEYAAGQLYAHRRRVDWTRRDLVPGTFPPDPLYELGAFLTWFRIKRYASMWIAVLDGRPPQAGPPPATGTEPPTGGTTVDGDSLLDADRIEQGTRDFLTRRVATHFRGHGFARLAAHLLDVMGYTTTVSPPGRDQGVDILAHRGALGLEPPLIKVQAKSSEDNVGAPAVAELLGRLAQTGEAGLFVTLRHYSSDARRLAKERANVRLIDGSEFVDLLLAHYDELDEEYRERFPLRRVWARELAEEGDDAEAADDSS
jgi:restriction system protein